MEFLVSNWMLIVALIAAIAVGGYAIYAFVKRPTTEQISKVKEWLLYAVTAAEKELGSGTGQIKLRYVYDMFIAKFPYLVKIIPFETFSILVDEALDKFRGMLDSNTNLQNYIEQK
ncbi:MAG: hypothetical protein NC218_09275 [Acetobacter sp.]|nr:hypothetical protein [Acetobacter sp.]